MGTIMGISGKTILLFAAIIATQIIGGIFLPRTNAFRHVGWTVLCVGTYIISFWCMSVSISRGLPLSMLMPILAATVPLALVIVGVVIYREPASLQKIAVLGAACIAIGFASTMK